MDVETMQLLHLSPIPELSEVELSTMMDQLSGLSDINGDFTDQHVESIIKEAEDLIDKSWCSEINEFKVTKASEPEETQDDENKHFTTPVSSDHFISGHYADAGDAGGQDAGDAGKHFNSPVEQTSTKVTSPGGSCNHIKSTIDSLKEFSTLIEKQLTNPSPNLSPKFGKVLKNNEKCSYGEEASISDCTLNEKCSNSGALLTSKLAAKKGSLEAHDKSVKLLNCFERLYQSKPVRLLACKKTKPIDKMPKALTKKVPKDFKTSLKNNKKKLMEDGVPCAGEEDIYEDISYSFSRSPASAGALAHSKTPPGFSSLGHLNSVSDSESKGASELLLQHLRNSGFAKDSQRDAPNEVQTKIDEKLLLKVLEEVEQIKDQVRKAGVFGEGQSLEKGPPEEQGVIDNLRSEVESVRDKVTSVSNAGIKRLQEQFSLLKFKYYQQMDKLEAENLKLREALHCQQKFFAARKNGSGQSISTGPETCFLTETRNYKISISSSPSSCEADKRTSGDASEGCAAEGVLQGTSSREAFCQTEKQTSSVSVQCTPDAAEDGKKEAETRKAENKENVTLRTRLGRSKPFSDVGIQQLMRQKKLLDHESQLLATLRGLQSEMTAKEKENRKLKTEMEALKKQIKKLLNNRLDNCRKSHVASQTIGLGPCAHKPYAPEAFEVPKEFEQENEDLRSRIRALEEDFEMLKEKRINDLQSLHQVHEEEMAKLVSKLETQSSLTKHLHSLLVNR